MVIGTIGVYMSLFLALYLEVFLLISFLENKPGKKTSHRPKHYPTVTIAVPSFNEERTVAATIQSLLGLEYPKEKLNIMVIDDGSIDNTRAIVEEIAGREPQVSYFYKENGGKHTALNFAIEHSDTELIGCLDADSFVAPDALVEIVKKFEQDTELYAIMPSMRVSKPRTILERMQAVEYTFGVFYKKMFDNINALNVLPGPFSIYRRAAFKKIGLFKHAHNTEDMEIAFRMHAHGLKIGNAHNAVVYTTVPTTVRKLIKQRSRWSQGFLENSRDYKHMILNPSFGNFGMLVLPCGLTAYFLGVYSAGYIVVTTIQKIFSRMFDIWTTEVPLQFHFGTFQLDWFYINTSMLTFMSVAIFFATLVAILMGNNIAQGKRLGIFSLFSYFALFGIMAPLWLVRAMWNAALSRTPSWR